MSKIDEKIGDVIDKLTKLVEQRGGEAVDVGISVAQINGASHLFGGIVFLGLTFFLGRLAKRHWHKKEQDEDGLFACVFASGGTVCTAIPTVFLLGEIWNWIALFHPKLYLAKQIMMAAGLK